MCRADERAEQGTTRMGFEPTRAEHNGLAVHRLNHSATSSLVRVPDCSLGSGGFHEGPLSTVMSKLTLETKV